MIKKYQSYLGEIFTLMIFLNQFKRSNRTDERYDVISEEGGFWITKLVSNSKDVLAFIPERERRKGLEDKELRLKTLPIEKFLGIHWNIEEDKLGFDVNVTGKFCKKR